MEWGRVRGWSGGGGGGGVGEGEGVEWGRVIWKDVWNKEG